MVVAQQMTEISPSKTILFNKKIKCIGYLFLHIQDV